MVSEESTWSAVLQFAYLIYIIATISNLFNDSRKISTETLLDNNSKKKTETAEYPATFVLDSTCAPIFEEREISP